MGGLAICVGVKKVKETLQKSLIKCQCEIKRSSDRLRRIFKTKYPIFLVATAALTPPYNLYPDLNTPTLHLNLAQTDTESPKIALCPVLNSTFQANIVLLLIGNLDPFHMLWLPVESHQSTDEQVGAVFGRLGQGLM